MKKLLCVLLCFTLFLVSCNSDAKKLKDLENTLSYPINLTVSDEKNKFTYEKTEEKATITVTYPETISGLVLIKQNGGISASYDGISVNLPATAASRLFMLDVIIGNIISSLAEGNVAVSSTDEGNLFSVSSESCEYSLTTDSEGRLISGFARVDDKEFEYTFTN